MSRFLTLLSVSAVLAASASAAPNDTPAAAADQAKGAEAMTVKVVSVTASVDKRNTADAQAPWQPVQVGDILGEQWLVRTGLGARAVIQMGDRNRVTIREGTKMGIAEFRKVGGDKVKTQLGLKYGSVKTDVDSSHGANDFKLATPVVTMAISGTNTTSSYNGDTGYAHQNNSGSSNSTNNGTGGTRNTQNGEGTDGQGTRDGEQNKQDADTGGSSEPNGGQSGDEQNGNNKNGGGSGAFASATGGAFASGFEGGMFTTGTTSPLAPLNTPWIKYEE